MSNFEGKLKEAFARLIERRNPELKVRKVTSIEQGTEDLGGCPTCGPYTRTFVEVWYTTEDGKNRWCEFDDNLFALIAELADYEGWEL